MTTSQKNELMALLDTPRMRSAHHYTVEARIRSANARVDSISCWEVVLIPVKDWMVNIAPFLNIAHEVISTLCTFVYFDEDPCIKLF